MGRRLVEGRIVDLGNYWMANHYLNDTERFLGWLVIQPKRHVMTWSAMKPKELQEFGVVTWKLEKALTQSYNSMHPTDKVQIVYLVRLAESTLEKSKEKWHLHWHMIPRTPSMKRKCVSGWQIAECRRKGVKKKPTKKKIAKLMSRIRHQFLLSIL